MSEIQVQLTIQTKNQISKKSLARKKPKLDSNIRYLKAKDSIFSILEEHGFLSIESSKSSKAYDGWGFDLEKRNFDLFWYFPDTNFGKFKASFLIKHLLLVEPKFKDLNFECEVFIRF